MAGTWKWTYGVINTTVPHGGDFGPPTISEFYVPLGENLQRVRWHWGWDMWWSASITTYELPVMGGLIYQLLVGSDGAGLEQVARRYMPWQYGALSERPNPPDSLDQTYIATSGDPGLDMQLKRTNGVDRDTQTHVQLFVSFFNPGPEIAASTHPGIDGFGDLAYLTHRSGS